MKENMDHRQHSPLTALEWDSYPFSDGDWSPCTTYGLFCFVHSDVYRVPTSRKIKHLFFLYQGGAWAHVTEEWLGADGEAVREHAQDWVAHAVDLGGISRIYQGKSLKLGLVLVHIIQNSKSYLLCSGQQKGKMGAKDFDHHSLREHTLQGYFELWSYGGRVQRRTGNNRSHLQYCKTWAPNHQTWWM